jgi:hypothetical protein
MKEINFFFKSPLFLFPWQLRQSLSYRLRLFWFRGYKIMGWGDVRYCFAMVILVIIITSPRLLLGDVLLFYVSFSLLLLFLLFFHTFLSALFLGDALIKLYETL